MKEKSDYIVIQKWMIEDLNLSGIELICYAALYGFSRDGKGAFYGSMDYLSKWANCTVRSCTSAIGKLEKKGLIEKQAIAGRPSLIKTVATTHEKISYPQATDIGKNFLPASENISYPPRKIFPTYNIEDNIANNIVSIGSSIEQPTPATALVDSKGDVQNEDSIQPKSSKPTSRDRIAGAANFEPPSFEQVKEGFEALIRAKAKLAIPTSIELHAGTNAEAFINFYSLNDWKVKSQGKITKMKNWKSSVLQWFLKENSSGRYNRPHGNDLAHQNKQKQERLQPAPAVLASSPFSRKVG